MANQYGPVAAAVFDGAAYRFKYMLQCIMFGLGHAKRVIGVNTGKLQGFLVEVGSREGLDVAGNGFLAADGAGIVYFQCDGGDFQQGVAFGVEACCFYINNDRQEAPKAAGNRWFLFKISHGASIPNRSGLGDVA